MSQSFAASVLSIREPRADVFKTGRVLRKPSPVLEFPVLKREEIANANATADDSDNSERTTHASPTKAGLAYPVVEHVASSGQRPVTRRLPRVIAFVAAFASFGVLCGIGMSSLTPETAVAPAPQLAVPNALAIAEPPKAETPPPAPAPATARESQAATSGASPATSPVTLPPPPKAQVAEPVAQTAQAQHSAKAAPRPAPRPIAKPGAHKTPPKKWRPKHR